MSYNCQLCKSKFGSTGDLINHYFEHLEPGLRIIITRDDILEDIILEALQRALDSVKNGNITPIPFGPFEDIIIEEFKKELKI